MNNSSGVAVVNAIDKLKNKEFDLVISNCVFILGHVLFKVIVDKLKHQIQNFLIG